MIIASGINFYNSVRRLNELITYHDKWSQKNKMKKKQ